MVAAPAGELKWSSLVNVESLLDDPKATDFVQPYIFFANRPETDLTLVSPSVKSVLGYEPNTVVGMSYRHFLCHEDPLNDDLSECERFDLSGGRTLNALRSVYDSAGRKRILLVHTVGVSEHHGGPVVRRHNIARDVTESVETHSRLMTRLQNLDDAARRLNRQERAVAEGILQGKMNRDIARELNVSDRTVERRRAAIMRHMDASNTSELVSKMVERDMLRTWTFSASDAQWQTARNSHLALASMAV